MTDKDKLYKQLMSTATFYKNISEPVKTILKATADFPPLPEAATVNAAIWNILKREIPYAKKVDVKYANIKKSVTMLVSAVPGFTVYLVKDQEELIKYWYSWVELGYYLNCKPLSRSN